MGAGVGEGGEVRRGKIKNQEAQMSFVSVSLIWTLSTCCTHSAVSAGMQGFRGPDASEC